MAGAGIVSGVLATSGGSSPPAPPSPAAVAAWETAAGNALTGLGQQEPLLAQQEQQWESGAVTTAAFVTDLQKTESVMTAAQVAVASLPPYPGQPVVDQMYQQTVALDVVVPEVQMTAATMPAGPLRQQVMLISDRVRELADRTFDQGRVLTAQGLVPTGLPAGSKVNLPLEVPDWSAEGLAAGPPLEPTPGPPPDQFPPSREGPRPTEPLDKWQTAVSHLSAPGPTLVQATVAAARSAPLQAMAESLDDDAGAMDTVPDPAVTDGRELSDRLRLSYLVDEEACRLAQAQALGAPAALAADAAPLTRVAAALVVGVPV